MMRMITIRCALLLCVSATVCCADPNNPEPPRDVEVSGIIVDGLDRPVPGATVTFSYHTGPYYDLKYVDLGVFTTDNSGRYAGVIRNWPESQYVSRWVDKSGYVQAGVDVSVSDDHEMSRTKDSRFEIRYEMPFEEAIERLRTPRGDELDQHVLEILASELPLLSQADQNTPGIGDVFFRDLYHFGDALRKACKNPHVGYQVRVFLEFMGELDDPNELKLIKESHRSTPKIEVSAPRLNDAVQAVAEAYKFFWEEGEEVYIDKTVFTMNYRMAMVHCHVHHGYLADRGFMLRFERLGDKWVLKALRFTWFS